MSKGNHNDHILNGKLFPQKGTLGGSISLAGLMEMFNADHKQVLMTVMTTKSIKNYLSSSVAQAL